MNGMRLFAQLTKVDESRREVHGRLAQEVPDRANEIMDYATSKPLFQAWSASFEKATGGKSLGNLRAMHGNIAAGKFTTITYDDTSMAVDVVAKVVDDAEWKKVLEGVYTGFSIGGSYAKKWADGKLTRYTAAPIEGSLVDAPCMPSATFSVIKSDGTTMQKSFQTLAVLKTLVDDPKVTVGSLLNLMEEYLPAEQLAKLSGDASTTMGDVRNALRKMVDEPAAEPVVEVIVTETAPAEEKPAEVVPDKPADAPVPETKPETPAADAPVVDVPATDAAKTVAPSITKLLADATAAHVARGITSNDVAKSKVAERAALKKGLYSVASFANLLQSIAWCAQDAEYEAIAEGDGSAVPQALRDWCKAGVAILTAMTEEEAAEMLEALGGSSVGKVELLAALRKAGARHSKADMDTVQAIHDHAANLGADCAAEKLATGELGKGAPGELEKTLTALKDENAALAKRLKALEDSPAPAKGVVRVIHKVNDDAAAPESETIELPKDPEQRALAIMKLVHAVPPGTVK